MDIVDISVSVAAVIYCVCLAWSEIKKNATKAKF